MRHIYTHANTNPAGQCVQHAEREGEREKERERERESGAFLNELSACGVERSSRVGKLKERLDEQSSYYEEGLAHVQNNIRQHCSERVCLGQILRNNALQHVER